MSKGSNNKNFGKCQQLLLFSLIQLTQSFDVKSIPFIILILFCILRMLSLIYQKNVLFTQYGILISFLVCLYMSESILSFFFLGQFLKFNNIWNLMLSFIGINAVLLQQYSVRNLIQAEIIIIILLVNYYFQRKYDIKKKEDFKKNEEKLEELELNMQNEELSKSELRFENRSERKSEHRSEIKSEAKIKVYEQSSLTTQTNFQKSIFKQLLSLFPHGVIIINNQNLISTNQYINALFKDQSEERLMEILKSGKNISFQEDHNEFYQFYEQLKQQSQRNQNIKASSYETIGQEIEKLMKQSQTTFFPSKFIKTTPGVRMVTKICFNENFVPSSSSNPSSVVSILPNQYYELILDIVIVKSLEDNQDIILFITDISCYNKLFLISQLNHNKSKLLRSVCHEVRNPLNCISQAISVLQDKINQEIYELCVTPIVLSTGMLLNLVNDLLDVSQINSGKFRLQIDRFDLKKLLSQIQQLTQFSFQSKQLQLLIDSEVTIISSDEKRVRQILINLVQNALKFTESGYIKIKVQKDVQDQIRFEVIDTGCGIQQQDLSKLFKSFSQIKDSLHLNKEGIGLGLEISNILCQSLSKPDVDGQKIGLSVESEGKGKGSKFSFLIFDHQCYEVSDIQIKMLSDISQPCKTEIAPQSSNFSFNKCDCKEILIVDDEPYNARMLMIALQKFNLKIDIASNGEEAFEKVITFPAFEDCGCRNYKLILMDIDMSIMDGCEATRKIREEVPIEKIKIIGCSGYGSYQAEICEEAGMDGYIEKPIKVNQVIQLIQEMKLRL